LPQNSDLRQLNQIYKAKSLKVSSKKMSQQKKAKRKLSRSLYLSDWKITQIKPL
jgi:hypothetical protein